MTADRWCRLCGDRLASYRGSWFGRGDSVRCLTGADVYHEPEAEPPSRGEVAAAELTEVRRVLEEALGRAPDPARSTAQLAREVVAQALRWRDPTRAR